jgi:hypothetical protein
MVEPLKVQGHELNPQYHQKEKKRRNDSEYRQTVILLKN